MREFVFNRACSADFGASWFARFWLNWQDRRGVAKLKATDPATLAIIGLAPEDIAQALELPLTQNARLALEQLAFHRSRLR
jgi:hypothetical protein